MKSIGPERADIVRGSFIAFEGLDGSGKSTALRSVARQLALDGVDLITTREPGGTPLGSAIRELVLNPELPLSPRTELLLMCADRAEHVEQVIVPALDRGAVVLCDRFEASTRAYQGAGSGLGDEDVNAAIHAATGGLSPDLYVLFDIDPDVAMRRRSSEPEQVNALDVRAMEFKQRVRERYLSMAINDPGWEMLDASRSIADVEADAYRRVTAHLARALGRP